MVAYTGLLRFQKFWGFFFVTFDFSPLYFILDALSSGFLGVCVCKVFGQTENDIIFSIFTMCMSSKSFRDAFFFSSFFFLDAPSGKNQVSISLEISLDAFSIGGLLIYS